MPLETATYISDLVTSNPAHSDGLNNADAHMRLIKSVLKNTLGPLVGPLLNSSGALILPDGSASAPAYSFGADSTAGFYRSGTSSTGIAGRLVGQGAVPIGSIVDFAGTAAPAGYLACNGQAVSRATYPELYAAIGTTWGAGDGSSTFNVPSLIDRYRRHAGGSHGGSVGTLQDPDVLPHTHAVSGTTGNENQGHTHAFAGTTGGMNANNPHSHSSANFFTAGSSGGGVGGGGSFGGPLTANTSSADINHGHDFSGTTGSEQQVHNHSFSVTSGSAGTSETRPYSATVLSCIRAL